VEEVESVGREAQSHLAEEDALTCLTVSQSAKLSQRLITSQLVCHLPWTRAN